MIGKLAPLSLHEPTFFILTALVEPPRHGYGVMQTVHELLEGRLVLRNAVAPTAGSLVVVLTGANQCRHRQRREVDLSLVGSTSASGPESGSVASAAAPLRRWTTAP